jgi:hypothetical protein
MNLRRFSMLCFAVLPPSLAHQTSFLPYGVYFMPEKILSKFEEITGWWREKEMAGK